MGIFSNKENSYLPIARNRDYLEYRFPNTGEMVMANINWLQKCMQNQKSGKAIWKLDYPSSMAEMLIKGEERFLNRIVNRIKGVPELILEKIEEENNQENIDLIYSQLLMGGALGLVEIMSELQINGLIHPSIHNAISLSQLGSKISNQNLSFGASKSLEVGYGLLRYEGEPVEKFITNLRRLQGS
jgi:hypothetical protein